MSLSRGLSGYNTTQALKVCVCRGRQDTDILYPLLDGKKKRGHAAIDQRTDSNRHSPKQSLRPRNKTSDFSPSSSVCTPSVQLDQCRLTTSFLPRRQRLPPPKHARRSATKRPSRHFHRKPPRHSLPPTPRRQTRPSHNSHHASSSRRTQVACSRQRQHPGLQRPETHSRHDGAVCRSRPEGWRR